jgi:SAM-dependent methyltransferase
MAIREFAAGSSMALAPHLFHLDSPVAVPLAAPFSLHGWVASLTPIASIRAGAAELALVERPDVRAAHPGYPHIAGFIGHADWDSLDGDILRLTCSLGDGETVRFEQRLPALVPPPDKTARLARLRPHLRRELPFTETAFHFNFLTPELRRKFQLADTEAVSSFAYGPAVRELIAGLPDGLILDCGAGFRRETLPNVVNLEIVPYPSTDVLALNEQLPFLDETFDAVISCAVLEHVKDPFTAARELVRVTKRGGAIYADVPFLQPYHGYPSHYYNMTSQGLVNLFQDACEIRRTAVPEYGLPIWTLTWFLNSYLDGLPPATRERFRNLRVADLLARPEHYLPQDFVRQLSAAKNLELASVTSVLAVKK